MLQDTTVLTKLMILFLLLVIGTTFSKKESFTQYIFKDGSKVYDQYYASIYDTIAYDQIKSEYEVGEILHYSVPHKTRVLDIGCGTGNQVNLIAQKGLAAVGLDKSKDMIARANQKFPNLRFIQGDANDSILFNYSTFTHITCFYYTIYYLDNKSLFFQNAFNWLVPGGYLGIHLVDKHKFNNIELNPFTSLNGMKPLQYKQFSYKSSVIKYNERVHAFNESIEQHDKKRKNEHMLYMDTQEDIVSMAQQAGFNVIKILHMIEINYPNHYIYVLQKPF
jgi:ubiquinone/menaquinone biosynthesis C-methylase UbiE